MELKLCQLRAKPPEVAIEKLHRENIKVWNARLRTQLSYGTIAHLEVLEALAYGGWGHCAMATPSDPKNKKNVKTVLSKTCFQNAQNCVFLGAILQNFPGVMPPDPLKWSCLRHFPWTWFMASHDCDETWPPTEIFCVRHFLEVYAQWLKAFFRTTGKNYNKMSVII